MWTKAVIWTDVLTARRLFANLVDEQNQDIEVNRLASILGMTRNFQHLNLQTQTNRVLGGLLDVVRGVTNLTRLELSSPALDYLVPLQLFYPLFTGLWELSVVGGWYTVKRVPLKP
jgi:hypothetical protein